MVQNMKHKLKSEEISFFFAVKIFTSEGEVKWMKFSRRRVTMKRDDDEKSSLKSWEKKRWEIRFRFLEKFSAAGEWN